MTVGKAMVCVCGGKSFRFILHVMLWHQPSERDRIGIGR